MGAWIETRAGVDELPIIEVAPYVGAWIETHVLFRASRQEAVAPYVGAWIETILYGLSTSDAPVAPYVGAWIETRLFSPWAVMLVVSHPMWVRGLKRTHQVETCRLHRRTLCGCVD